MIKEELPIFIKKNMESKDFTGGVDEKQIDYVEDTLKLKLQS